MKLRSESLQRDVVVLMGGGKRWGLGSFDCAQDKLRAAIERLELLEPDRR